MATLLVTLGWAMVSTVPGVYAGLFGGYFLQGRDTSQDSGKRLLLLRTIAAGLTLWYFLDIMVDSTFLGLNQPESLATLSLVVLFILGVLVAILVEPRSQRAYDPIFLAAAIVAMHGVGEGIAIGATLVQFGDPIMAVGGLLSGVSFVTHKAFEAFIVSTIAMTRGRYYSHLICSGLVIGLPTVLGALLGYLVSPNATFLFALGGGASVWLLSTLLVQSTSLSSRFRWSLLLTAGMLLMFLAGTLHSW